MNVMVTGGAGYIGSHTVVDKIIISFELSKYVLLNPMYLSSLHIKNELYFPKK